MVNSIIIQWFITVQAAIMPYASPTALRGTPHVSRLFNLFIGLVLCFASAGGLAGCQYSADSDSYRVRRVIDGDSIRVSAAGEALEVRLAGIDAPEYRQPYAEKAKQLLAELVLDGEIKLRDAEQDRYGRTVAVVVRADDELVVNAELIRQGAAWAHPRYARAGWFKLERAARSARRGLWASSQRAIPPWDWRREHGTTYSRK